MERGENVRQVQEIPARAYSISLKERRLFKLSMVTLAVLELGIASAIAKTDELDECDETDVVCELQASGLDVPVTMELDALGASLPIVVETTTTLPPETTTTLLPTTTTLPPPPPPVGGEFRNHVAPETLASLDGMQLTLEGYQAFFTGIDYTWYDYTQSLIDFSPLLVSNPQYAGKDAIPQNATEWITAHFTAGYTNFNEIGAAPVPTGLEMDLKRLIDFSEFQRGHPCCGFNFVIDRNGRVFQLAPFNAKLRHNPPYDGRTTGFEIEAAVQEQITAKQYEQTSYLVMAMLANEGRLDPDGLAQYFHGHGEDRTKLRAADPHTTWDVRSDFNEPVMNIWREYLANFIRSNSNIATISQQLR